jgi:hypothetical protein
MLIFVSADSVHTLFKRQATFSALLLGFLLPFPLVLLVETQQSFTLLVAANSPSENHQVGILVLPSVGVYFILERARRSR